MPAAGEKQGSGAGCCKQRFQSRMPAAGATIPEQDAEMRKLAGMRMFFNGKDGRRGTHAELLAAASQHITHSPVTPVPTPPAWLRTSNLQHPFLQCRRTSAADPVGKSVCQREVPPPPSPPPPPHSPHSPPPASLSASKQGNRIVNDLVCIRCPHLTSKQSLAGWTVLPRRGATA